MDDEQDRDFEEEKAVSLLSPPLSGLGHVSTDF